MNQTVIRATAGALGDSFGKNLVGVTVLTPKRSGWAGGLVTITEYLPDENEPAFTFWGRDEISGKECALFADEQLGLFVDTDSTCAVVTATELKQRAVLALAAAGFVMPQLGIEVAA